jgi:hypothetical protein
VLNRADGSQCKIFGPPRRLFCHLAKAMFRFSLLSSLYKVVCHVTSPPPFPSSPFFPTNRLRTVNSISSLLGSCGEQMVLPLCLNLVSVSWSKFASGSHSMVPQGCSPRKGHVCNIGELILWLIRDKIIVLFFLGLCVSREYFTVLFYCYE